MLNYVNGASFQHLRRIFDEPKITEMAKKYRFTETKQMKGVNGEVLFVCKIQEEDNPKNFALLSDSSEVRFRRFKDQAMKVFWRHGKLVK